MFFVIASIFLGAFSIPKIIYATTIYQQLSDSSGSSASGLVGSFISNTNGQIEQGDYQIIIINNDAISHSPTASIRIRLHTTPATDYAGFDCGGISIAPGDSLFCSASNHGPSGSPYVTALNGNTNWVQGTQYDIYQTASLGTNVKIITNLSGNFFNGYITDNGLNSIPIAPGIPGFTDQGIATTSQATYCNSNFSTSSGLFDSIGQSISIGFCQVGAFLFVPSTQSISNFQSLASTSQNKIPISYFYDINNYYVTLTASSSDTVPTFVIPLHDLNIGSSTPLGNLMPNIDFFSTTTISKYLPDSIRVAMLFLASSAIWVGVLTYIWERTRRMKHKS